ncbi:hypothetical protein RJ639_013622 [Escallonia herrerae]|uniref:Uncharacterized protein n=1 Tax=Escallonia herrerae TaxID=1293975 RepID=A0AA89AN48_9ASTE|nr:hypothetical protein RJ639_013622 [Escallonia herrerae]
MEGVMVSLEAMVRAILVVVAVRDKEGEEVQTGCRNLLEVRRWGKRGRYEDRYKDKYEIPTTLETSSAYLVSRLGKTVNIFSGLSHPCAKGVGMWSLFAPTTKIEKELAITRGKAKL